MHVMALFKLRGEESLLGPACIFPRLSYTQIQAGELLTEDVTWFVPGLANTFCKILMDLGREAGAEVKIMIPFCAASVISHF